VLFKTKFYHHLQKSEILAYDCGDGEDSVLQECDAPYFGGYFPKFRRIDVHPFAGGKQSKRKLFLLFLIVSIYLTYPRTAVFKGTYAASSGK
jgi:hypothetical protein